MPRLVLVFLTCCFLMLSGCASTMGTQAVQDLTDDTFIAKVSELINAEKYVAAHKLAEGYRERMAENPASVALTQLVEVDIRRLSGHPEEAWELFETISPDYFPAPWTRAGMEVLYDLGRRDEAYDFCAKNIPRIPQYHLQQAIRTMCVQRSMR